MDGRGESWGGGGGGGSLTYGDEAKEDHKPLHQSYRPHDSTQARRRRRRRRRCSQPQTRNLSSISVR